MPTFLIESYGTDRDGAFAQSRERAMRAAELGVGIRYVRTTFLREDETFLHVFEARPAEALRQTARLAALPFERIVDAVEHIEGDSKEDTVSEGVIEPGGRR